MTDTRDRVTAPPTPAWQPPKIGDVNILEVSIGARGSGKSTAQAARALELQRELGAYVIGHSLGRRLPREIPAGSDLPFAGSRLPLAYHASIEQLDRGLRKAPASFHVLAPALTAEGGPPADERDTADDLIQYVIRLSAGIRRRAWEQANPWRRFDPNRADYTGLRAPPVILIVDEGIAVEAADRNARRDDRWFHEFLYSLRHLHVGMLWAIQEPSARSWKIIEAATECHVYQVRHEWALQALRSAGAGADGIEQIRQLDLYECYTIHGGARRRERVPAPDAAPAGADVAKVAT